MMRRSYILLDILLVALLWAIAAQAVPTAPAPIVSPPLMTATTIQVSIKSIAHAAGKPDDIRFLSVKIERPDKLRIEEAIVGADGPADGTPAALLVTDGKKQYEYAVAEKTYFAKSSVPLGDGMIPSRFGLTTIGQLPLVLGRSHLLYTLAGTDSLQGRIQHRYESELQPGSPPFMLKLWVDAQTHLPTRRIEYSLINGQSAEVSTVNFLGWKLNAPITGDVFAWSPPDGAKEYVAAVHPPLLAEGTVAPDFSVQDKDGNPVKLSDFRGKTVLLDFWATWCGPCQQALPHTSALARQYKDKTVVVLGVNVWDKKDAFIAWLPQHPDYDAIRFVIDPTPTPDDVAARLYHVWGIPTQYVIDSSGKVLLAHVYDGTDDAVDAALQKAAGKS